MNKVSIFDSLYSQIDHHTEQLLAKVFESDVALELAMSPKQQGVKDCGVFAIAISTSLAHGQFPISSVCFDQSAMRDHLVLCYERQNLTFFPTL